MAKKPAKSKQPETVKAIKGFDADLKCRGFQYEVGKSYEHQGGVVMCSSGFHACEGSPFDVWGYYGPVDAEGKLARYADVSMAGFVRDSGQKDSKICAAKITIDAEISLPDFIRRAVSWVIDATKGKGDDPSGDYARIGSSGNYAQIGSSGNYARIGSSGDSARIGSSGNYAQIVAEGAHSVVASAGPGTSVSGADGTWISVAEFKDGKCVGFATGCIGKDGLLPNTPYIARDGKLVPAA
jgi:hypothetical protein